RPPDTATHHPAGTETSETSTADRSPSAWTHARPADRTTVRTGQRTPDHPAARRPAPTRRATSAVPEAARPPTATPDRLQYETRWPRPLLAQGLEAILPVQHRQPADQRADFFRSK